MIAAAYIERLVPVIARTREGVLDLGTYRVRPPSAREAIMLLQVHREALSDDDAWAVAADVMRSWLPARLWSRLLARTFPRRFALQLAVELLSVGLPEVETKQGQMKQKAAARSWDSVVSEYLHVYPGASLEEPWPFFVDRCLAIDEVRALDELSAFMPYAVAQTGKGLDVIQRRAGQAPADEWDEEAALARQRRSLEHLSALHQQMTTGKVIGLA